MKKVKNIGEKNNTRNYSTIIDQNIGDDCTIIDMENYHLVITIDKISEKPIALS